jgi:hypothetical protein
MTSDPVENILRDPRFEGKPITWGVDAAEYDQIRHAWLTHVAAEERLFAPYTDAVWKTQIQTMLSVFTDDCVMELVPTGQQWMGKQQAAAFYDMFIPAFEAMEWVPQALVIGPQGVLDVVNMKAILRKPFAGLTQLGQEIHTQWVIYFPWAPDKAKLRGEIIYSIRPLTPKEIAG